MHYATTVCYSRLCMYGGVMTWLIKKSGEECFPFILGTNLVLGPPEKFYRRNPSGAFWDVHWYHLGDPKKVPGAPSQGFLTFLGFDKNSTKIENWLSYPHFWADIQVSYHFGKLLTARSQGFTASKNQSLDQ